MQNLFNLPFSATHTIEIQAGKNFSSLGEAKDSQSWDGGSRDKQQYVSPLKPRVEIGF